MRARLLALTVSWVALAAAAADTKTRTNLDGIDLKDTSEDAGSARAGEALAQDVSAKIIGQPAPLAVMKTIDGEVIDLGRVYGKRPVYLKFWATWCTPCRQQMPAFERMYETLGDKMQIVAVDIGLSDDEASVRALRAKYGLKMPIVMDDGHLASLFHLSVTPQHVLIGKDVRFAYVGHAQNDALEQAVARAIADTGATATATAAPASARREFQEGDLIGKLAVTTLEGKKIAIGGPRPGRLQAVELFSSWCEWYLEKTRPSTSQACVRTRKSIEAIASMDRRVDWLGVAGGPWSTTEDLADYQKKIKVSIALALDESGKLFQAFGVRDLPTVALIDSRGRLVRRIGPGEGDLAEAIRVARP